MEKWEGYERRRRRECWEGKPELRKKEHKYSMADHVKTPQWLIPIGVTAFGAFITVAIAWGSMSVRQDQTELKVIELEKIEPVVAQQQIIIPEIQKTVENVRVAQISFNEKYDKNREADQRFFQELLREVKKA